MIIGVCGFGSTGSSVVSDYLREFNNMSVVDDLEFNWVSKVDSLIDLERAIMYPHGRTADSIMAIQRYLALVKRSAHSYERHGLPKAAFEKSAMNFIEAITQVSWNWYKSLEYRYFSKRFFQTFMIRKYIPWKEKKTGHQIVCWPMKRVFLSVKPRNFYEAAQKHIDELLTAMGIDLSKSLVLDQPFSGNNPQACFPFYHDPYAIVVDRDPRDNYVFAKTRLLGANHFMAVDSVQDFILYYRALRKDQPYLQSHPRVLRIQFEDMVYQYEKTTEVLRDFLHLSENARPKSVFDPELSVANTQVFKRYPEFAEDVKVIERELPEYLYDFSEYPEPDFSKKMFYGKSPLNKNFKKKFIE